MLFQSTVWTPHPCTQHSRVDSRCWLVLGGNGSVLGCAGEQLVVEGPHRAVLVHTWWYWVIIGQYWAVLGFILESLIVGRFVVFRWEICSFIVGRFVVFPLYQFGTVILLEDLQFFVGTVYCCKICSYLLGDLKLICFFSTSPIIEKLHRPTTALHFRNLPPTVLPPNKHTSLFRTFS